MTPSRRMSFQLNGWFAELADHVHSFDGSICVEAVFPGESRPDDGTRTQKPGGVGAAEVDKALGTSASASAASSAANKLHRRTERRADMATFLSPERGR